MSAKLDQHVGEFLAGRFRHESRRSFLSRVTRGLFALAGVTLPAAVKPYAVHGQQGGPRRDPWEWCGLHGPICEGNCDPNRNGNRGRLGDAAAAMTRWVACCKDPMNKWRCVRYADYCGVRGPNHGRGCRGKTPSGVTWCSGVVVRDDQNRPRSDFICTHIDVAPPNYDNARSCTRDCHPDVARCEPQE
jgi:hypothetical protein